MINRSIHAKVVRLHIDHNFRTEILSVKGLCFPLACCLLIAVSPFASARLYAQEAAGEAAQDQKEVQVENQDLDRKKAEAPNISAKKTLEVYENEEDLVLVEPNGPRRLVTPRNIHANGRYLIRMKKPEVGAVAEAGSAPKTPSQDDLVKARKHLFDANEAFFKGDLQKTWSLIDEAEKLDPGNYRIMSMKGSLLYRIGSKDLAVPLWEQSLAINPDQPEIRQILEKTVQEKTALDRSVPDKSKGEVKL